MLASNSKYWVGSGWVQFFSLVVGWVTQNGPMDNSHSSKTESASLRKYLYAQSVFKRYHSDKHFSDFYLQDGGKNQLA